MKTEKNVIFCGLASFLNDTSSEMIVPILPLFITALGECIVLGLVGGVRDCISSILKVIAGYFSDRLGKRKFFIVEGYLISSTFKLMLGVSKNWGQVLVAIGLERVDKGLRTVPRDVPIAESIPKQRGKRFVSIERSTH